MKIKKMTTCAFAALVIFLAGCQESEGVAEPEISVVSSEARTSAATETKIPALTEPAVTTRETAEESDPEITTESAPESETETEPETEASQETLSDAGMVSDKPSPGTIEEDYYYNEYSGIGFTLPAGWTFDAERFEAELEPKGYDRIEMGAADYENGTGEVYIIIDEITVYPGQMTEKFQTYFMTYMADQMNNGYEPAVTLPITVGEYPGYLVMFAPVGEENGDMVKFTYFARLNEDYIWLYNISGKADVVINGGLVDLELALSVQVTVNESAEE